MSSQARTDLTRRLKDFDEIMTARDTVCPANAGRPAQKKGAALIRSAVVMLAASFEGYIEEVFDAAVDLIHANETEADRKTLKKDTSGSLNNASVFKVNRLFFNLGLPWIMQHRDVRWQKFTNAKVQETLGKLVTARNSIAHGGSKTVSKLTAKKWKGCVERLADRIDVIVSDHVQSQTGNRPW
ncbi:HEPN domain-containing protein [Botrimarina colliarenosi]|nr:HEPN domain-containing protein [Botrimarina colliarenosi]